MLRYLTGGESHGRGLVAILEGIPANLEIDAGYINRELNRRQGGYGRGGRMSIEKDEADILSGIRFGMTTGSPVTIFINNKDWENWKDVMDAAGVQYLDCKGDERRTVTHPRPGHADLAGAIKYNQRDIRNIIERSSARETAARVAVGAVCKRFLEEFGVKVMSWVVEIGGAGIGSEGRMKGLNIEDIFLRAERSVVRSPNRRAEAGMKKIIDEARAKGDTVGGIFKVAVTGVPPGIGSHIQWDKKLDARLAMALMSIQAIKGVEVGIGFDAARLDGSKVHDEIFYGSRKSQSRRRDREESVHDLPSSPWPIYPRFYRKTNNAGGIEGGMSNGEPIVVRAAMKPIPTLKRPLNSVDIIKKWAFKASIERSDICAVPAASVIGEAVVAYEVANLFMEKFGGDSVEEVTRNYKGYLDYIKRY